MAFAVEAPFMFFQELTETAFRNAIELPSKAKTPEEARARLSRFLYAEYTGKLSGSIPVPANPFSRIAAVVARLFQSK